MNAKHTCNNGRGPVFGRLNLAAGCARCLDLAAGAPVRKGWGQRKRELDAARLRELREHDCKARGCGPVCTFGDW